MLIMGIDCGITGAIGVIDAQARVVALHDLPIVTHGRLKWIDGMELVRIIREARSGYPARVFVEATHGGTLGTVAANSKGLTLGSTLVALQFSGVPYELLQPQTWKRGLGMLMPKAGDKEKKAASLARARMLFPAADLDLQKHHNRAEALLIAHYAQRYLMGAKAAA